MVGKLSITRLHASQVLDQQVSLKQALASAEYRYFVDGMYRASTQPDSVTISMPFTGEEFCRREQIRLGSALAYQVTPEMCDLVEFAWRSWPAGATIDLTRQMLPSEFGFVWLDKSHGGIDIRGRYLTSRALTWGITHETVELYESNDGSFGLYKPNRMDPSLPHETRTLHGVRVTWYTDRDDPDDEMNAEIRSGTGEWQDAKYWERAIRLGRLHVERSLFFAFGEHEVMPDSRMDDLLLNLAESGDIDEEDFDRLMSRADRPMHSGDDMCFLAAFWTIMRQEIVSLAEGEVLRASKKRAGRAKVPDRVTVIMLRRRRGQKSEGESLVEWTHQWIVRGHWRWQPYGPRDNPTYDWIWIHPYLKGPEDAPLAMTEHVYKLAR